MGSNKTSLLLVMTILMLRKNVKLDVIGMVRSLSSGKGKMFLCAACHAFTPHVNAWKNLIGIVVQIQARG